MYVLRKNGNISNGDLMNKYVYKKIADKYVAKEHRVRDAIVAFISGGFIGMLGEGIIEILCGCFHMARNMAGTYMILIMIFLASFCTALGFFDKLVSKFKCGLLIPITGFAHSIASSILDYKNEGFIYGFGSNVFKLAGSVLLYGIVAAVTMAMIRYLLGGVA